PTFRPCPTAHCLRPTGGAVGSSAVRRWLSHATAMERFEASTATRSRSRLRTARCANSSATSSGRAFATRPLRPRTTTARAVRLDAQLVDVFANEVERGELIVHRAQERREAMVERHLERIDRRP